MKSLPLAADLPRRAAAVGVRDEGTAVIEGRVKMLPMRSTRC
jgi:hypothetical protein